MIRCHNFPPEESADAEFTPETLKKLEDRRGESKEIKKIGKRAGGIVIANIQDRNIGVATEVLYGMVSNEEVTQILDGWGDVESFMQGAIKGMLHEIETETGRRSS